MKEFGWVYNDGHCAKKHVSQVTKEDQVYDDLGRKLISRKGSARLWHFALSKKEKKFPCDDLSYKSNKGTWHRNWQSYSPSSHIEVYKLIDTASDLTQNSNCHIADMIDKYGNVVEFQHSNISASDIKSREYTYGNMYWIVDATTSPYIILEDGNIIVKEGSNWWDHISKPILLDIGIGMAFVQHKVYKSSQTRYYYCHFLSYYDSIMNLFVLKPDFKFLEEHLNPKAPLQTIRYRCKILFGQWNISCSSEDDPELMRFGFERGRLTLYVSKEFLESLNQTPKPKLQPFIQITPSLDNFINRPEDTIVPKGKVIGVSKLQFELTPDKKCIIVSPPIKRRIKPTNWQIQNSTGQVVDLSKNSLIELHNQQQQRGHQLK